LARKYIYKAYNFIRTYNGCAGEFTAKQYHLFPAMKQNLSSQQFQDDCKVETAAVRWLKIWGTDFYSMGNMETLPIV